MNHKITATIMGAAMSLTAWAAEPTAVPADGYPDFALGADVSWTNRITDAGTPKYYVGSTMSSGLTTIPDMVSDYGLDAVRLRVWVDPSAPMLKNGFNFKLDNNTESQLGTAGYCDAADMLSMALTYGRRGQRIMVCFHLSDTWADPGRQFIPAAWADCTDAADLASRVAAHVTEVLTMLRDNNVNVAWVQIGNETNTGMLKNKLPASSGAAVTTPAFGCTIDPSSGETVQNFVNVFRAAADASRAVYPEAKTVLHLANGHSWNSTRWTLEQLRKKGFDTSICDYVGLSLYPANYGSDYDYTSRWATDTQACIDAMRNITDTYGFRTLLCEIGMNNEWSESIASSSQRDNIAQCNADTQAFVEYLLANLKDDPTSSCDGLFYWAPEVDYLDNYKKGACYDVLGNWSRKHVTANTFWSTVKAASTFPAGGLVDFETSGSGIGSVTVDGADSPAAYYNLQGMRVERPQPGGMYILRSGNRTSKIIYRP